MEKIDAILIILINRVFLHSRDSLRVEVRLRL